MIVEMKKVSLVILKAEKEESLKALRKAGVVHLEALEGNSPELAAYKEASSETEKAISLLEEVAIPKKQTVEQVSLTSEEAIAKAKEIIGFSDAKKSLFDKINQNTQELARLEKWGSVDPVEMDALKEKGLFLYMYEIPQEKYSAIGEDVQTVVVNTVNKVTRFVVVSESELEDRPQGLPAEAYAVPLPELSTAVLQEEIAKAKSEIERLDREILTAKKYEKTFAECKKILLSKIEFENISSGMQCENPDDLENPEKALAWLTGYVPVDAMKKFKQVCSDNSWAFIAEEPREDDPVPTKLKNNKVVSLIYPLTNFLDVTPGYHEYDISGWFLLFFCIFFAMIFGDAGYGALISAVALMMMGKGAKTGTSFAPINVFILLLGLCTMTWGVLTCTWFGIEASRLPAWMVDASFAPISAAKVGTDKANTNQQIFCFILAILQLSVAHTKGILRYRKSLKCLGELGALLELWGMFYVVLDMVVDPIAYPLGISEDAIRFLGINLSPYTPVIALGVLGFGFALNFVFSNYDGSIKNSIMESCKNIISVLLGIVNVFSDIVSYIRLWAVALAGAAISNTVNTMAGPMFGKLIMVVFGVILLCFGHGLNMVLNLLSVIVHGVRLNTLEFSQHLGMSWSGSKYKPFSEN